MGWHVRPSLCPIFFKKKSCALILFMGSWNDQGGLWDRKGVHKGKGCGLGGKRCGRGGGVGGGSKYF